MPVKVEGLVKYALANFKTPIPIAPSYEALNGMRSERCLARQSDRRAEMVGERLAAGTAVADVAQAAIIASSDLPEGGGCRPVKNQRWAQEIEATDAKKSTVKKSKRKKAKRAAKKTSKKSKKKKL